MKNAILLAVDSRYSYLFTVLNFYRNLWSYRRRQMKKKLILVLGVLVALTTAIATVIALKAGDFLASYKPEIQQKLSQALGADVSIGDVSLSIFPNASIVISQVRVKDRAGGQDGISFGTLKANATLAPLFSGRVEISSIALERPKIILRKEASGVSISGIEKSGDAQSKPTPTRTTTEQKLESPSALQIKIDSITVRNGEIRIEDTAGGKTVELRSVDLDAAVELLETGLRVSHASASLVAPGAHAIRATIEDLTISRDNTALAARDGTIETSAGKISISGSVSTAKAPGTLHINSNALDLASLSTIAAPFAPELDRYKPSGSLKMQIDLKLAGLSVASFEGPLTLKDIRVSLPNAMNLSNLSGDIAIDGSPSDMGVTASALRMKLQDTPLTLSTTGRVTPNDATINALSVKGFGGEIQAPLRLSMGSSKTLGIRPAIRSLSLEGLLRVFKPDLAKVLSGTIVDCTADFRDIILSNAASSLNGSGNLLFKDGVIKGFNLPNQVFSNIDGLPFISGNLRKRVPPDFERYVSQPDTSIKELRSQFSIQNGVAKLSNFVLISDIFTLQSSGTVAFDGELGLDSEILFSPEFSIALTAKVKEFKTLLDKEQRLVVPLIVRGKAPAIVVVPNVSSLVQKATIGTVRQTLGGAVNGGKGVTKSLGKILGF